MPTFDKDIILGRGKLYFDRFASGSLTRTGEMYFGNTPSLSLTRSAETLEHFDSDSGLRVKDLSATLSDEINGSFQTDNIKPDNIALFFSGIVTKVDQALVAGGTTEDITVNQGRFYQIGRTANRPAGLRQVTVSQIATVAAPGTPIPTNAGANWEVDSENGRIYIPPGSTIPSGTAIRATYGAAAHTYYTVTDGDTAIYGALRFISENAVGKQRNYFFPYVKLMANGDFALKGDEWQTMNFDFQALKLDSTTPRMIVQAVQSSVGG